MNALVQRLCMAATVIGSLAWTHPAGALTEPPLFEGRVFDAAVTEGIGPVTTDGQAAFVNPTGATPRRLDKLPSISASFPPDALERKATGAVRIGDYVYAAVGDPDVNDVSIRRYNPNLTAQSALAYQTPLGAVSLATNGSDLLFLHDAGDSNLVRAIEVRPSDLPEGVDNVVFDPQWQLSVDPVANPDFRAISWGDDGSLYAVAHTVGGGGNLYRIAADGSGWEVIGQHEGNQGVVAQRVGDHLFVGTFDGRLWVYQFASPTSETLLPGGDQYFINARGGLAVTPDGTGMWTSEFNGSGVLDSVAFYQLRGVTPIPEPAGLALLALGGLWLMRRR